MKPIRRRRHVWKVMAFASLWLGLSGIVWAKWEKEQVALESQLQERIESILSKTLPATSYLVSNDPAIHFGLGAATKVDRVEVLWPDGTKETFGEAAVDKLLVLRKGATK